MADFSPFMCISFLYEFQECSVFLNVIVLTSCVQLVFFFILSNSNIIYISFNFAYKEEVPLNVKIR